MIKLIKILFLTKVKLRMKKRLMIHMMRKKVN